MQSVIETLDGRVPDDFSKWSMRWMPPEAAVVEREKADAKALEALVACGMAPAEVDA